MRQRRCIIVGANGQDGFYLTEYLINLGCDVLKLNRNNFDISNKKNIDYLIDSLKPCNVYYLAAYHHSAENNLLSESESTLYEKSYRINTNPVLYFLESINKFSPSTRFFFASSSHIFAPSDCELLDENSEIKPTSSYAITKYMAMLICRFYRDEKQLFVSSGILFNHESSLRNPAFLSRKISLTVAKIFLGKAQYLELGELDSIVDWGYAPDYVDAMYRILRHYEPNDYVIATGVGRTVREFVEIAFSEVGLDYRKFVRVNKNLLKRPSSTRIGSYKLLHNTTGWKPKTQFETMVRDMIKSDIIQLSVTAKC